METLSKILMAQSAEVLNDAEMKQVKGRQDGYDGWPYANCTPIGCGGYCSFFADNVTYVGTCLSTGNNCYCKPN